MTHIPMSIDEFKELERLLGRLESELGHRYVIQPHALHDGYYIAIYDDNGLRKHEHMAATIKDTVIKIEATILKNSQP